MDYRKSAKGGLKLSAPRRKRKALALKAYRQGAAQRAAAEAEAAARGTDWTQASSSHQNLDQSHSGIVQFKVEVGDTDENILKQLPDLGIVKEEPLDPDDPPGRATSSTSTEPTSILPDLPVSTDTTSSSTILPPSVILPPFTIVPPSALLPGIPASRDITTPHSTIVSYFPSLPGSSSASPSTILPDIPKLRIGSSTNHISSKLEQNDSAKRSAMKRAPTDISRDESVNSLTSNSCENRDEFAVFGEFVATKLRNFKDRRNQLLAQNAITGILIEMEMKDMDEAAITIGPSSISTKKLKTT